VNADNPRGILRAVRELTLGRPTFDRLLRLFACAAARAVWIYVPDDACRRAVEVAERFADGSATAAELELARAAAERRAVLTTRGPSAGWVAANAADPDPLAAAQRSAEEVLHLFAADPQTTDRNARTLGHLLDDLFGPFLAAPGSSPADPPPEVLAVGRFADDHAVRSAAEAIEREDDFRELRLFGEKLWAAGCRDRRVIDHCCAGRHARGCWVIDAARVGRAVPDAAAE
jgi:hypothetical protein